MGYAFLSARRAEGVRLLLRQAAMPQQAALCMAVQGSWWGAALLPCMPLAGTPGAARPGVPRRRIAVGRAVWSAASVSLPPVPRHPPCIMYVARALHVRRGRQVVVSRFLCRVRALGGAVWRSHCRMAEAHAFLGRKSGVERERRHERGKREHFGLQPTYLRGSGRTSHTSLPVRHIAPALCYRL